MLRTRTALLALLLATACSQDPGERLAPTDDALRDLTRPAGMVDCPEGSGRDQAPLCWQTDLAEPAAAAQARDALAAAGATGLTVRCGVLGTARAIRCEIAGELEGHRLDVAVHRMQGQVEVFGFGADQEPPTLLEAATPLPVP